MKLARNTKVGLIIYAVFLVGYCAASGSRLLHRSGDVHFSYQADMFLHGRLDLGHSPPNSNDWAEVEYLHLKDGRTVAGAFLRAAPSRFKPSLHTEDFGFVASGGAVLDDDCHGQ